MKSRFPLKALWTGWGIAVPYIVISSFALAMKLCASWALVSGATGQPLLAASTGCLVIALVLQVIVAWRDGRLRKRYNLTGAESGEAYRDPDAFLSLPVKSWVIVFALLTPMCLLEAAS